MTDSHGHTPVRVHDLLRIENAADLIGEDCCPDWVHASLERAPWVVVRRVAVRDGLIAVGVRGAARALRHAAWLAPASIGEIQTPEAMADRRAWRGGAQHDAGAALPEALERVHEILSVSGLVWGPAGSAGFELASGVPTVTASSDLDLIVRVGRLPAIELARGLQRSLDDCGRPVDCLIELPGGAAIALREYARGVAALALRTPSGPQTRAFA